MIAKDGQVSLSLQTQKQVPSSVHSATKMGAGHLISRPPNWAKEYGAPFSTHWNASLANFAASSGSSTFTVDGHLSPSLQTQMVIPDSNVSGTKTGAGHTTSLASCLAWLIVSCFWTRKETTFEATTTLSPRRARQMTC